MAPHPRKEKKDFLFVEGGGDFPPCVLRGGGGGGNSMTARVSM